MKKFYLAVLTIMVMLPVAQAQSDSDWEEKDIIVHAYKMQVHNRSNDDVYKLELSEIGTIEIPF